MGAIKETSKNGKSNPNNEGASDCEEQSCTEQAEPKFDGVGIRLKNRSKEKRNRRKERKRNLLKNKNIKILGLNCAGILNKLESFEDLLIKKEPSIFCLQETKVKRTNQITTESSKKFTIYELIRKKSNGGGLAVGVHKDLQPAWVDQGDDEVEALVVEIWVNEFPIRIINGYGPQMADSVERKQKFWAFLEKHVNYAIFSGAGLILQMDGNYHLGPTIIDGDKIAQNTKQYTFNNYQFSVPL